MASTVDFAPLRSNEEHEFGKIENNDNVPKGKIISCIQIRKTWVKIMFIEHIYDNHWTLFYSSDSWEQ